MTRMKRAARTIALAVTAAGLFCVLGPSVAEAGTASSTFTVSALVNAPCSVSVSNMTFPPYLSGSSTGTTATSDIAIGCAGVSAAAPLPVYLTFSTGSGAFAMTNGADSLNYTMCSNAVCDWAYSPGVRGPWFDVTTNPHNLSVFGSIDPNQAVPGGVTYAQTVTATLTF